MRHQKSDRPSRMRRSKTTEVMRTSWLMWAAMVATLWFGHDSTSSDTVVQALAAAKSYRYFGYGSNVIPSTMKTLRQIEVREVTAAVLPGYELKFKSAAFVRPVLPIDDRSAIDSNDDDTDGLPCGGKVVHGLMYTLTEDDFAKVGSTEGVPFGYRWQSCLVYPYRGDGNRAGEESVNDPDALPVQAYTLVEPTVPNLGNPQTQEQERRKSTPKTLGGMNDGTPPSASYLGLIREGARLWKFDKGYQDELATVRAAKTNNFLFPEGWEGPTLQLTEKATGTKRTYMIDGY